MTPGTSADLAAMHDAVHGVINLKDLAPPNKHSDLVRLLNSPPMRRLRRIKLLGYAAHRYVAADHSRYAHAIGTLHVMDRLLNHLDSKCDFSSRVVNGVNSTLTGRNFRPEDLRRHLLMASLLQDLGELPFSQVTKRFYRPSAQVLRLLEETLGGTSLLWTAKQIFTLAMIIDARVLEVFDLDAIFLAYLITGVAPGLNPSATLRLLRQMVDGHVDADRLDYVHRDLHHTVGPHGNTDALISSLIGYDEHGPTFGDPGPITQFLFSRAFLWSNVYFAPPNRFRNVLLANVLREVVRDPKMRGAFLLDTDGISLREFGDFDEERLTAILETNRDKFPSGRGQVAINLLLDGPVDYECRWISRPKASRDRTSAVMPPDLFFDGFSDYQEHSLFSSGTITIESERFGARPSRRLLEQCSSPFRELETKRWSGLEAQDSVLLYIPRLRRTPAWRKFEPTMTSFSTYCRYWERDPFSLIEFPLNTEEFKHFGGRPIFISFDFRDFPVVNKILDVLCSFRRRYYLLAAPFEGYLNPTDFNSRMAARRAGYLAKLNTKGSNIAAEFAVLARRRHHEPNFRVAVVKTDPQTQLRGFPLKRLKLYDNPFIGRSLRFAGRDEIEKALKSVIEKLDGD
jgi:HD superfamily phosphohydrolase